MNKTLRRIAVAAAVWALAPAPARAEEIIVAEVNGKPVTAAELSAAMSGLSPEERALMDMPAARRRFVESYITEKILLAEARRRKIDRSPKYVRWAEQAKNEVLLALLQEQILQEIRLTEQDLKDFYAAHQKDFAVPEKRRARHILMPDEKKARAVLKRIRAGASFEDEARRNSQDRPSAAEGGDLGWNAREDWVPEFAKVVFSLKAGEVADQPVKTRFGWHVIRLEAVQPEAAPPLDEIREKVLRRATAARGEQTLPEFFKALKKKSAIKIHDSNLDALNIPSASK